MTCLYHYSANTIASYIWTLEKKSVYDMHASFIRQASGIHHELTILNKNVTRFTTSGELLLPLLCKFHHWHPFTTPPPPPHHVSCTTHTYSINTNTSINALHTHLHLNNVVIPFLHLLFFLVLIQHVHVLMLPSYGRCCGTLTYNCMNDSLTREKRKGQSTAVLHEPILFILLPRPWLPLIQMHFGLWFLTTSRQQQHPSLATPKPSHATFPRFGPM